MEIWKDVVGYEGVYRVSSTGRMRSIKRDKILTPKINWDKYHRIQLWRNGKNVYVSIHRVVAEAFLDKPDGCDVVNHKNGIKDDNRVENLEWVTQQENIIHSWENGLSKHKLNGQSSRKVDQFTMENEYINTYASQREAERQTGVSNFSISACCRNISESSGGFKWRYCVN